MKKRVLLKIIFYILIAILLFSSIAKAEIDPYVGVKVGDEFNFNVLSAHLFLEHNFTKYIDSHMMDVEGKTINIKVDAISEGKFPDFFMLYPVNKTIINTTETVDGSIYKSYSVFDQWYDTLTFFLPGYFNFIDNFDPLYFEFSPPENYEETYQGLPVFATTNKSFYEQIMNEGIVNTIVGYNEQKGNFSVLSENERFREGTSNTTGYWNVTAKMEYLAEIDTNQGTLRKYKQLFGYEVNIGINNTKMLMKLEFENEANKTTTIGFNFVIIGPLMMTIGILSLFVGRRKKENNL